MVEYYKISWFTFARQAITTRSIPLKSIFFDVTNINQQKEGDAYFSKVIQENINNEESFQVNYDYKNSNKNFIENSSINIIKDKIIKNIQIDESEHIDLSIDLLTQNFWQANLIILINEIPLPYIGKGAQSLIKTKLALPPKTFDEPEKSNVILLEEPENHLSHSNLNKLINHLEKKSNNQQIIITTHSSFVANKLSLENLILMYKTKITRFEKLSKSTYEFFKKLPGYDVLRFILCEKIILVAGNSDELILQKSYIKKR